MGESLRDKLKRDLVFMDGALGTYVQSLGLPDRFFKDHAGCMEYLSVSSPDIVSRVHSDYLEAGSDAVETNTFGGNRLKLEEYGLAERAYEINRASAALARREADRFSTPEHPRYVIGAMGPTGRLPSSSDPSLGNISYGELKDIFFMQASAMIEGGADAILVETGQDLLEIKAAVNGARKAAAESGADIVIMAQCTLTNNGRMLLGTEVSAFMAVMGYLGADVVGLNCGTGPAEMEMPLSNLARNAPCLVSCVPNAGLPVAGSGGKTVYSLSPAEMASIIASFVSRYRIDVIGGCCGTTPEHIRQMRKAVAGYKKRAIPRSRSFAGSYRAFDLEAAPRPIKVGERMNSQGSRKMKSLLVEEDYDSIVELGKSQQCQGAGILDLCTVMTERATEKKDMSVLTRRIAESLESPLMVDSTDTEVIREALENYPGTPFINSANLEDGGEKARKIFALAGEHAGSVVCLSIDEQGMARTVEKKLEIASRLYAMAVEEYGIEPHRLIFDMLTFTLGTGEQGYRNAALDTIKAIELFKRKYPDALTILGVSNVSFGLETCSRKAVNSVFLDLAVKAGLDMAIVDPAGYPEKGDIPAAEKELAEDLVLNRKDDALSRFVEYFSGKTRPRVKEDSPPDIPGPAGIKEKLYRCVLDRDKAGIIPLIDEALKGFSPESVINDILMEAMKEAGNRLDRGEMVLPYVLQSAEVMKKAMEYLEKFLSRETVSAKGKVILATVEGDVHDIGKNLVKMILENNGFVVIDLGKQVPVSRIIEEARRNKADAVGLSALLVSTSRHMKSCVQSMHDAGLDYPIMVGGSPVNERFAREIALLDDRSFYRGGVFYARDAFTGLRIMRTLTSRQGKEKALKEYLAGCHEKKDVPTERINDAGGKKRALKSRGRRRDLPFEGPRTLVNIPVDEVFERLDKRVLFEFSWGAKLRDEAERSRIIENEYEPALVSIREEAIRKGWLDLKAVYGYFNCRVDKNGNMEILGPSGNLMEVINFTPASNGARISDNFIRSGDIAAFQAVTVGDKVAGAINGLIDKDEAAKAFYLHGFSVNLAEALASYVHDRIRSELGIRKGAGNRYSPGYPLWKDLGEQKKLFRLLDIEKRIEVRLTADCQMVPEQSTTAIVVRGTGPGY